jgi:hypothetical protein
MRFLPGSRSISAAWRQAAFPVDRSSVYPYFPRHFPGFASLRERVAQPVEQLTFNQ